MHTLVCWFTVRDSMRGQLALEWECFATFVAFEVECFMRVEMFSQRSLVVECFLTVITVQYPMLFLVVFRKGTSIFYTSTTYFTPVFTVLNFLLLYAMLLCLKHPSCSCFWYFSSQFSLNFNKRKAIVIIFIR